MSLSPLVSVIIPVFNAEAYIACAVESVFAQTYENREIIVVNDGSTDQTVEILKQYGDRITLMQSPNAGPSTARNIGIQASHGEFLVFLDADDWILPEKLARQVHFLLTNPEIGVVYSGGYRFRTLANGSKSLVSLVSTDLLNQGLGADSDTLSILLLQNPFPIHCAMCRRETVVSVGGFDAALYGLEDWDLWLRIAPLAAFAYLPGEVAIYRQLPESITYQQSRQIIAYRRVCEKIEQADWFENIRRNLRAKFYLNWSVHVLMAGSLDDTRRKLSRAIETSPVYLPAQLFNLAVMLMGKRALAIYRMKRLIFGPRSI